MAQQFLDSLICRKELQREQVVPIMEGTCSSKPDLSPGGALSRADKPSLREPLQLTAKSRDLTTIPPLSAGTDNTLSHPQKQRKEGCRHATSCFGLYLVLFDRSLPGAAAVDADSRQTLHFPPRCVVWESLKWKKQASQKYY